MVVAPTVAVHVGPLASDLWEGVPALLTQGQEHAWIFLIGDRGILPVVVVAVAVAVKVFPLFLIVGEDIVNVSIAIQVGIRASQTSFFKRLAKDINTVVPAGNVRVVTVAITVGVGPLERIVGEGIKRVGHAVKVGIWTATTEFSLGFTVVKRAKVAVVAVGVVAVAVAVFIAPLRRVGREQIPVVASGVVAVAVTVAVLPLARVVGEGVRVVTRRVVASVVTVSVRPLGCVVGEGVSGVGIPVAVPVNAACAVDGGAAGVVRAVIGVVPVGVAAESIVVFIAPLRGVVRESVCAVAVRGAGPRSTGVGIAVAIGVGASESIVLRVAVFVRASVSTIAVGVVANPVSVGVHVLGAVERESIGLVGSRKQETGPR